MGPAQTLVGLNAIVDAGLGTRAGPNLFHSFRDFNIGVGGSVTFTGPAGISNVVSRVTGGNSSQINGLLRSTVPGAHLWILNPAGILFGPNATLDLPASLNITTADEVNFADGSKYGAGRSVASSLSASSVESFGFLGAPAALALNGGRLALPSGQRVSLVAGDITIQKQADGYIGAPGGTVNIVSVAGPSTIAVSDFSANSGAGGRILIQATEPGGGAAISTTGNGGGYVRILGGSVVVDQATIAADNTGSQNSMGGIQIDGSQVELTNHAVLTTDTYSDGNAGSIVIVGHDISVRGSSSISSNADPSGTVILQGASGSISLTGTTVTLNNAFIQTAGSFVLSNGVFSNDDRVGGETGNVTVSGDTIMLENNSRITNFVTSHSANTPLKGTTTLTATKSIQISGGGRINSAVVDTRQAPVVTGAGEVLLTAPSVLIDHGVISSYGISTGPGALIVIQARSLDILNATIGADIGRSFGPYGPINLRADTIRLAHSNIGPTDIGRFGPLFDSPRASIFPPFRDFLSFFGLYLASGRVDIQANRIDLTDSAIQTDSGTTGDNISIKADQVNIAGGSQISALGDGVAARAGDVTIIAHDLTIVGDNSGIDTSARGGGGGAAGQISINVANLTVAEGGSVSSQSAGTGTPGVIAIDAEKVVLDSSSISARNTGAGPAGSIVINSRGLMTANKASVTTEASAGNGGGNSLAARALSLRDSIITTTVLTSSGNGGDIHLDVGALALDSATIRANAFVGRGGGVAVVAGRIVQYGGRPSVLQANSVLGVNGVINLSAPNVDSTSGIVALSSAFTDASNLLAQTCAVRESAAGSTLFATGKGGVGAEVNYLGSSSLFEGFRAPSPAAHAPIQAPIRNTVWAAQPRCH